MELAAFKVYTVTDIYKNPCPDQDYENNQLEQELQYPPDPELLPTVYSDPDELLEDRPLPGPMDTSYVLLRAPRPKYKYLYSAQKFFDRKRIEYAWTHECPIYRTHRAWCKRVFGGKYPPTFGTELRVPQRIPRFKEGV